MSRRPATAHGHLKLSETARQIPGYLVFLANWANVVEIVPRRLAGTKPPARTRPLGNPISAVRPIQGDLPLEDTCVSCDARDGKAGLARFPDRLSERGML